MTGEQRRKVLNVGGGSKAIALPAYYRDFEHLILDIDPRGKPDIVCDARELLTRKAGEFDAIYCSHNLEHYFRHDVPRVLRGFHHVLTPDGFAEIRVPDIGMVIKEMVSKNLDLEDTLYNANVGPILVRDVIYGWSVEIERSGQDFYAHKTGFTSKSMTRWVTSSGFQHVLRRPGRVFELLVYAFKQKPTAFHEQLLNFSFEKIAQASSS
jgi:SAM-dependent methyltransferase